MAIRRRRLPHIDILGQPVFVTFRLHDSLPAHRSFPAALTAGEAFAAMDRLLDHARSGPMFLAQPEIAHAVLESLEKGISLGHYDLHAWAIMPNHVHLLITPRISLARLLDSLKGASAKRANLLMHRTGQRFWQEESYDHLVRSDEEFRHIRSYIENNPVRAGLAGSPETCEWSSARRPARPPQPTGLPHKAQKLLSSK